MIRSAMGDVAESDYGRIFGHTGSIISGGSKNSSGKSSVTLVDDDGKPISRVTTFHKNKIYKQVKQLKEDLRYDMCTKSECNIPTDKNVQKMIYNEFKNPKIEAYKLAMKAIGADPKDCNTERLRRK